LTFRLLQKIFKIQPTIHGCMRKIEPL
jgi:hypothetical protein